MKIKKSIILAVAAAVVSLCGTPAQAAKPTNVLVIDSGTDFTHKVLKPMASPNLLELKGKENADDDSNGYADDVYGWNFVENNSTLVNLQDTPPDYDTVLQVMQAINKMQQSGQDAFTEEEWSWLVKHYNDKKLKPWINFCGGWAHGTHCAGIIASNNKDVAFKAIRHIPTGSAPQAWIKDSFDRLNFKIAQRPARRSNNNLMQSIEAHFEQLGREYAQEIQGKAKYIAALNPRLINCSFGMENSKLFKMMKMNLMRWGVPNATDEEVQKVVNAFVTKAYLPRDKAFFSGCKDALVFIAAGNSSENLDNFVTSPNNVPIPNKIVIAATDENRKLADFSCYGVKTVDVAVPGVNIYATYPNNKMGYMSGTSMACPNALGMASLVLKANPELTAVELKKILMGTVDVKEWLKDKVRTSGVINVDRAIYAANQMKNGKSVTDAIKEAKAKVADMSIKRSLRTGPNLKDPVVRKMYYSNLF